MTNRIAVALAVIIIAFVLFTAVSGRSDTLVFLAKQFAQLLDWIAFWR